MPLTLAKAGEKNVIRKIGGNESTRRFLETLGFISGADITVISSNKGNLIVNIKDSRVAVAQEMAKKIMI